MAIIRFEGQETEVSDGSKILEACEEMGVPFGCQDGLCGTCISTVLQGMENLEPVNVKEEEMGLAKDQRLMCQCVIRGGLVEIACD